MVSEEIYKNRISLELTRACMRLANHEVDSAEYVKTLAIVERLHGLLEEKKPSPLSRETLVNVGANLLGILMIIKHENVNVITSKALGFVTRIR